MKYLIIVLGYATVIPLWSVASLFLSAPNDVGFYTGVLMTLGIVAYVIFLTHRLAKYVTSDVTGKSKINSES